jgi:hypothetical protein
MDRVEQGSILEGVDYSIENVVRHTTGGKRDVFESNTVENVGERDYCMHKG